MLTPDRIADDYRQSVELGLMDFPMFVEAMRRAFNAGTLATEHKVVEVADHYRAQLADKQALIDMISAGKTPTSTANQGHE